MSDQEVPSLERCQVKVGAGLPLAATVKLTAWPAVTVAS
jgi:hypothetical protein